MPAASQLNLLTGRLLIDPSVLPELGWLIVDGGMIVEMGLGDPPHAAAPLPLGGANHVITPAFIDAHIHLPQIESAGCDGMPLLEWLDRVIYPAEQGWGHGYALEAAQTAVRRMLRQGTMGFAGYLTSHAQASAEVIEYLATQTPMRFKAGRVAMDRQAPDALTSEDRTRAAQEPSPSPVLDQVDSDPRHGVSANPRFAIACSDELLAEIGDFAREHPETCLQTHLAESMPECALIKELFPNDPSYTAVYDRFGLLTDQMLLAHCIHLNDDEWRLIAQRNSVVVHCPTANLFLHSGLFDLDKAREHKVRLALGSDVAGGPDVAMPRVARACIETAKARTLTIAPSAFIPSPADLWRLITRGNAEALGWTDAGKLEIGAAADLLVLHPPETWLDEHLVGRLLYGWSSRLIEHRLCNGRAVKPDTISGRRILA